MKANKLLAKSIYVIDQLNQKGQDLPLLVLSSPGFGKTSTIRSYCELMDYNLVTLIPSQNSCDDILGIQAVNAKTNKLERITPSWFNMLKELTKNGKRTLLFIDELTATDPFIQAPLLDLVFSHNLGEEKLPDNVFIVSAGNYSVDLNNEFKMNAPLVNRFLILNLLKNDFNIAEILDNRFETLATKEEKLRYFGLDKLNKAKDTFQYCFSKFKDWIQGSDEIGFGDTMYIEDPKYGLLGFLSLRSMSYALKFAEEYMITFDDSDWIRVVGDTMGTSNKRESGSNNGIPLKNVINSYKSEFFAENKGITISDIVDRIKRNGVTLSEFKAISDYLDTHTKDDISEADYKSFRDLVAELEDEYDHQAIQKVVNKFVQKMQA